MSTSFIYGQTINYSFTLQNNEEIVSLPTSGLISARLYGPDTRPTNDQRDRTDSSGYIQEVTTWSGGSYSGEKIIVFSGISDPDPHSINDYDKYYIVTNFYIQESDQKEVLNEETIHVLHPDAWISRITITYLDLARVQSKLTDFFTSTELGYHIESGKNDVFSYLKTKGLRKTRIFDQEKLNEAVKYSSLASCCFDLASEEETIWMTKFNVYTDKWHDILDNQLIPYDNDNDNDPDLNEGEVIAPSIGTILINR